MYILIALSLLAFSRFSIAAGTNSSGGDLTKLYRAVCHTSNLSHFIFVGLKDSKANYKVVVRNQDSTDPASVVASLQAKEVFVQSMGEHFALTGSGFSLDLRTDLRLPGGAGTPGSVNMLINGTQISAPVACQVF